MRMDDGIDLIIFMMGVVMAVVLLILLYWSSGSIP
jgi:hypothetical protein